ncbi:phage tail tape measure protein [Micromonospora sp. NPDC049101]|uniref:phage tail tape measure protein n=1 Tax=Micromonospora sp. NPDC049101 TaxID=3155032 RepID=UPI0033D7F3BE
MSETRQLKVVIAGDAKSARQALKVLGTGLDQADKDAQKAGKGVEGFNNKVAAAAEHANFALMGLAAAAAGLGVAFAKALEFDGAQAKFAAQMGPENAGKLGKVAGKLYSGGFGESMTDNMEAIRKVTSSGLINADANAADIERVTGKAQNLSKVFGQDVTQTARAAGQMVKTGLAKNADEAFDMLTRGFQVTGDHADDLLDTMNEYGTQFRKVGLNGQQAMGLIQQGLKAGARDTDIVADAIKEFSIRAVDGSKLSAQGFKALGMDASTAMKSMARGGDYANETLDITLDRLRNIKDPAKRAQTAVALFGTQAEDLGDALYALDVSKAAGEIGKVGGAADAMGKTMKQSASAQLEQFKRKVETAIIGRLAEAIPKVIEFGQWMAKNKEWIGPIVAGLGTFAVALGVITVAAKVYTAVQAALNLVMMANPIGIVVLALIALVAALVYAWNNSETFRKIVIGAWNGIKSGALAVVNWFKTAVPAAWNSVSSATSSAWNSVKNFVSSAMTTIKNVFLNFTGPGLIIKHWDTIKSATSSAFNAVKSTISNAFNSVKSAITGALSGAGSLLYNSGRAIIDGLVSGIRNGAGRVTDAVKGVLSAARKYLPFSPAKKGPFSGKGWTLYSGRSIPEALAKGINSRKAAVVNATRGMVAGAAAPISAGLASRSLASRPAAGGVNVAVHVGGNVTAERDLGKAIALVVRDEIARNGRRNGGTGL